MRRCRVAGDIRNAFSFAICAEQRGFQQSLQSSCHFFLMATLRSTRPPRIMSFCSFSLTSTTDSHFGPSGLWFWQSSTTAADDGSSHPSGTPIYGLQFCSGCLCHLSAARSGHACCSLGIPATLLSWFHTSADGPAAVCAARSPPVASGICSSAPIVEGNSADHCTNHCCDTSGCSPDTGRALGCLYQNRY
ncbi:hypothetical protein BX661DRAFT_43955 [Kickxella alabastrina]|uniref:uncharacterized protein n=1 Tax=Kickxella alabastrina TaxID=61397 RepID=UPI00221EAD04|nr:uncharacterized protein BX661DRAFT_43955 [Kickxella alabastrina]KAI7824506.1 hypothetical protein BX661DRAFT_43955 [Kickxella alabastrina]